MPLGFKPKCFQCESTESVMWRPAETGHICNDCFAKKIEAARKANVPGMPSSSRAGPHDQFVFARPLPPRDLGCRRRLNEAMPNRNPPLVARPASPVPFANEADTDSDDSSDSETHEDPGEDHLFPQMPLQNPDLYEDPPEEPPSPSPSPPPSPPPISHNYLLQDGIYFLNGDVVQLRDSVGDIYYAQIRGLMCSGRGAKSAFISWLLPVKRLFHGRFDPTSFVVGPMEDSPRPLRCMAFIQRAPPLYCNLSHRFPPAVNTTPLEQPRPTVQRRGTLATPISKRHERAH